MIFEKFIPNIFKNFPIKKGEYVINFEELATYLLDKLKYLDFYILIPLILKDIMKDH